MQQRAAVNVFIATAACGILPALAAVITEDKLVMHEGINDRHYLVTDVFFKYFTHLGDGLVPVAVALFLLWKGPWRAFVLVGGSAAFSALIAQFLKRMLFSDMDRPSVFFAQMPAIDVVAGIDLHSHFSFPSGHSTAAFSTCFALAVLFNSNRASFLLALLASLIGFSRIYLSQHFTIDVIGGAAIGSTVAAVLWWWLYGSPFSRKTWLDRRPFKRTAVSAEVVQNQ